MRPRQTTPKQPTENVHVTPASTGDHGAYPAPLLNRNQYPAAFPTFDTAQLQALGPYARPRRYAPGETLFSVGEREFRFYVLSRAGSRSLTVPPPAI